MSGWDDKYNITEMERRRYPHDQQGAKNEWRGLIKHQDEINHELRNLESEIKNLKQQDLITDYEAKQQKRMQIKNQEMMDKQQEMQAMNQNIKHYQNYQQQLKMNKNIMQQDMADQYDQIVNGQKQMSQMKRQQELDRDRQDLEKNRVLLQNEQKWQQEKKEYIKNSVQQSLMDKNQLLNEQRQQQMNDRDLHNRLCYQNGQRQEMREQNYRNFYNAISNQQDQKCHQFEQNVLNQERNKQYERDRIINNRVQTFEQKRMEQEMQQKQNRYQNMHEVQNVIKQQMVENNEQKQMERTMHMQQFGERMRDLDQMNNYDQFQKQQKIDNQYKYKQFLDQQKQEKDMMNLNGQRMTKHEKKLNYNDLQAYKVVDQGMYSMIPGWSPQIGGYSERQKQVVTKFPNYNNFQNGPPDANQSRMNQIMNKSKMHDQNQLEGVKVQNNMHKVYGIQKERYQHDIKQTHDINNYQAEESKKDQFIRKRMQSPYESNTRMQMEDLRNNVHSSVDIKYGHNPITNPNPTNNQNPYIQKQFVQAAQNRSQKFQNLANQNIVSQQQVY